MAERSILFNKVSCNAYLKKIYDGKFIEICKGDIDGATYCDTNKPGKEILSECCGDLDFLKNYYELTKKTFSGIVVGFKPITISAYLVADTQTDLNGAEFLKIMKKPKEIIQCVIVYYASGRKRYVPLENIEEGD